MLALLCCVLATLVAAAVSHWRWRHAAWLRATADLNGPPSLPLLGNAHMFLGGTDKIMTSLKEISYLAMKQGGITKFWIGPVLYFVLVEPSDIEFVLKTCLEKDDLHRFLNNALGNGIIFAPVAIWRRRRKILVPAFSPKVLEPFLDVFLEQSEVLVEQLQRQVGTGAFDAWPFFSSYSLDSICKTVMGIEIKAQRDYNTPFLVAMNRILNLVCERIFHLWQQPDWLYRLMPSYKEHQHNINVLHSFTDDVIAYKKEELAKETFCEPEADRNKLGPAKGRTFLSMMISLSEKDNGYSNLELREEVLSLTIAGTDTSGVATCFTLLLLGKHQDVQERVYQELLDVYGNSQRPLVKEDLSKLCYLERVIKESLRLYPPGPFIVRKVEKDITLPSGRVLPAGCGVAVSIWGTHRNPTYWGADAERFDPDRFSPERYNAPHPCAYIPFSAGPRNCIGYQYAMMSIKTSLSRVLRQYRVLASKEDLAEPEIRVKIDVMLKAADGYNVLVEPRKK